MTNTTVEAVLAVLIAEGEVTIDGCPLAAGDRMIIVKALKDRARWMASDITSGERPKKQDRQPRP